jgi:hypothetical protein
LAGRDQGAAEGIVGTLRIGSSGRDPLHELARKGARDMEILSNPVD